MKEAATEAGSPAVGSQVDVCGKNEKSNLKKNGHTGFEPTTSVTSRVNMKIKKKEKEEKIKNKKKEKRKYKTTIFDQNR